VNRSSLGLRQVSGCGTLLGKAGKIKGKAKATKRSKSQRLRERMGKTKEYFFTVHIPIKSVIRIILRGPSGIRKKKSRSHILSQRTKEESHKKMVAVSRPIEKSATLETSWSARRNGLDRGSTAAREEGGQRDPKHQGMVGDVLKNGQVH